MCCDITSCGELAANENVAVCGDKRRDESVDLLSRWRDGFPRGTVPPHDPTTYEFDLRAGTTSASAVEDGAIALIELRRIAHVVASGQIQRSRWEQLVTHRIGDPRGAPPAGTRVAVHRTATRLAYLVDHAA